MDRLTIDTDGKSGVGLTFDLDVECPNMDTAERLQDLIVRLGQLEKAVSDANGHYDINRLRELAAADRDGRVVVLPCKVGDRLYYVRDGKVKSCRIGRIGAEYTMDDGVGWADCWWTHDYNIGKTVFLTRVEAEAALKEQEAQKCLSD